MSMETIKLPNGTNMPILGFGTWQAGKDELTDALNEALTAGYRHIDTAPVYHNEDVIGEVLNEWITSGKLKREDLFIVTKLPPVGNRPGGPEKYINKSLKALQITYLDLYLVHTPFSFEEDGDELRPVDADGNIRIDTSTDHIVVWKEMEQLVQSGKTKATGLSNFNITQITRVLEHTTLPISNLQIELHVYFQQRELVDFCKKNHIIITAYSPLGTRGLVKMLGKNEAIPSIMENPTVISIAKKYNKTPAQIALKFIVQKSIVAIPKSTNPVRMRANIDLFDFELDNDDIQELENLDMGPSARICDFGFFKGIENHPEFPF